MMLTSLEREFLQRISSEPWPSPPLFDHNLIVRLIEAGLVQTETLPDGAVLYEIKADGQTDASAVAFSTGSAAGLSPLAGPRVAKATVHRTPSGS